MESADFKKMFGEIAKDNGFEKAFEGWIKTFTDTIHVLDLQKSNYGNFYFLNIKIFIQGTFGNTYVKKKQLVKNDGGDIFIRQPDIYSNQLNLEIQIDDEQRKQNIKKMFDGFLTPFSEKTSSKEGIKILHKKGDLFILPSVKDELGI